MVCATVEVDGDTNIRSGGIAHCLHTLQQIVDCFAVIDPPGGTGAKHFYSGEALCHLFFYRARCDFRCVRINPAVHGHLVTHRAAQQVVYRHAQRLTFDIPQCLVNTGKGAGQHRTAAVESAAVQRLPDMFNTARILPNQIRLQLMHACLGGSNAPLYYRLTPANEAAVSFYAQQQPAGLQTECL